MAYKFFDPNGLITDEEEKRRRRQQTSSTPSQGARENLKSKGDFKFFDPNSLVEASKSRTQTPIEPVAPTEKENPSLLQRAGSFIKDKAKQAANILFPDTTGVNQQVSDSLGISNDKLKPEYYSDGKGNPIERYNDLANKGLLSVMSDKYNKLYLEQQKDKPNDKTIQNLEQEIRELDKAVSAPVGSVRSTLTKSMVGKKYGYERAYNNLKAGSGYFAASILDALTLVSESQSNLDKGKEEMAKAQKISDPKEREKQVNKVKLIYGDVNHTPSTRQLSQGIKKWAEEASPTNPDFIDNVTEGSASMAGFLVMTFATGGGAATMSIVEAASEAGSVYEDNRNKGKSIAESNNLANADFLFNLVINYVTNKTGLLSENARGSIKKAILSANNEGIQEGLQQIASNVTTGKDPMEGVLESYGVGGFLGGAFSFGIPDAQVQQPTEQTNVNPEDRFNKEVGVAQDFKRETITKDKIKDLPKNVDQASISIRPDGTASYNVEISENSRGKGVGSEAVKAMESEIFDRGITQVKLPVKEESVGFFEKQGYSVDGEVQNGLVPMSKTLSEVTQKTAGELQTESRNKTEQGKLIQEVEDILNKDFTQDSVNRLYDIRDQLPSEQKAQVDIGIRQAEKEGFKRVQESDFKKQPASKLEPITDLNPTGGVLVDYTPQDRVKAPLGDNITTLDVTSKKGADDTITIYRGAPTSQSEINAGDFITTDPEIANTVYKGTGHVISKEVRLGDVLDDIEYPNGGEYIYRPNADKELKNVKYDFKKSEWYANYKKYLSENKSKFKTLDSWIESNKASGKTKQQLTEVWNDVKQTKKTKKPKKKKLKPTVPSGIATTGDYATVGEAKAALKNFKSVEFPELVKIAREFTGKLPQINNRLKTALGRARVSRGVVSDSAIELNPEIFQDEEVMSKVLAHEIGHIADWLPEGTLKRGNLVGRVASMNQYLQREFKGLDNTILKNELQNWTQTWNPFDEKADTNYTKYRYSSKELYAEALSGLLVEPALLKQEAPRFWNAFFEYLDNKPKVKDTFFATWDVLNKGEEAIGSERYNTIKESFERGEDLYRVKQLERDQERHDVKSFLRNQFIDKNATVISKIREVQKSGTYIPDETNPEFFLEGINYTDGLVRNFLDDNYQPIRESLDKADITWDDFAQVLFLNRVVNERGNVVDLGKHVESVFGEDTWKRHKSKLPDGFNKLPIKQQLEVMEKAFSKVSTDISGETLWDEVYATLPKGIANPFGFTTSTASDQLKFLEKTLGSDKWKVINENVSKFKKSNDLIIDMGAKEGLWDKELVKEMKANPAYATFQVLDYLNLHIPSSIKKQRGTLKDIANVATSTMMKNVSIIKAVERNKATRLTLDFMKENFPSEVQEAKTVFTGRSQVPVEPKEKGLALVSYMKDGKYTGYYVDRYIADGMQYWSGDQMQVAGKILRTISGNRLYRPLFTSANLGFQTFNLFRDAFRFYKNVPTIKFWQLYKVPQRYAQAFPSAVRRAWRVDDALIKEMQGNKILGLTFNDIALSEEQDTQVERFLQKYDIQKMNKSTKRNFFKPITAILDLIEKTGNTFETLPKVAGYLELQGKLPPNELASYIRKNVGSPDFLRKGKAYPVYNEIFLFSNAIKEGVRSDIEVATQPSTRSGWWMKSAMTVLVPRAVMLAIAYGLYGDKPKEIMEGISEYDKSNYLIVPFSIDENGKSVYLRIPQDETSRTMGALFWKAFNMGSNEQSFAQDLQDVFSLAAGQIPTVNPTITILSATKQFLAGENPYDYFRGRNIISDTEFEAGGKYALKPFLEWVWNAAGGGVFYRSINSFQAPETKTWIQKVTDAPLLSNIVGRWIKTSDYGIYEKNQQILKNERRDSARESLRRSERVDDAIEEYRSGNQDARSKRSVEQKMVTDLYGKPPYDKSVKSKITNDIKKFRLGLVKGEADPYINSLISAQSNDEKYTLLVKIQSRMSGEEFKNLAKKLYSEKIVSASVLNRVNKERTK